MKVRLSKEQRIQVLNAQDVYMIMQQILLRENKIGRNKEHIWIVCLSNSNRILLIELTSLGTQKNSIIDPMEVFSFALQKRAAQIIMVHNHPAGSLNPSMQDRDITDRMYQAGKFLDLPIIDHLIITEESYYSFKDSGLLQKISKSRKYVIPYKKEEERIEKRKATEMAKILKKRGVAAALIAEASGLPREEIEKL